ncbi:MAG: hypothetical protein ACK4SM_00370 [Aquificaceae bacterium]
MPLKSKVLVVRRLVVGDEDLLVKVYGWGGMMNLYAKDGALPESGYASIFEPFNLLQLVYRQSGEFILPLDVEKVYYMSYLASSDYRRFLWMSSVLGFFEKWISYYDLHIFNLLISYMSINVKNMHPFLIRFKIDLLKTAGLYRDEIFEEGIRPLVKKLSKSTLIHLERLRIDKQTAEKIDKTIDSHLEGSLGL